MGIRRDAGSRNQDEVGARVQAMVGLDLGLAQYGRTDAHGGIEVSVDEATPVDVSIAV